MLKALWAIRSLYPGNADLAKENLHKTAQVFGSSNVTSWRKGFYWADNFVPRVSWGARSPGPGITGNMDPMKMVGIMGHHTAGRRHHHPSHDHLRVKQSLDELVLPCLRKKDPQSCS